MYEFFGFPPGTCSRRDLRSGKTTFIYALVDPRDDGVRYIGKSDNPRRRLREHKRGKEANPYRDRWVAQLALLGLEPLLIVLEECSAEVWQIRERFWEQYFRQQGHRLSNLAECGRGRIFYCTTEEFREKMSAINRELNRRPDVRAKRSEGAKRIWQDPEWRERTLASRTGQKRTAETRQKMSEAQKRVRQRHQEHGRTVEYNVKSWPAFVSPEGVLVGPLRNLSAWCRERGLDPRKMSMVARGTRRSHKGWSCPAASGAARPLATAAGQLLLGLGGPDALA